MPQSQRSEPSASPVRHSECTRVSTAPAVAEVPRASARCTSPGGTSKARDLELAELRRQQHADGVLHQVGHRMAAGQAGLLSSIAGRAAGRRWRYRACRYRANTAGSSSTTAPGRQAIRLSTP